MSEQTGTFYAVSVGPGDPELLTLQAVRVLENTPVIAAPQTASGQMLALDIARGAVDLTGKSVLPLRFTMSHDAAVRAESYRAAAFEEMVSSDDRLAGAMLECDGRPAGYGLASKMYSQEAGGIQLWLEELFVLPEYRSRGLGREFIAYMESLPNVARIRLEYERSNTRAAALYRKLGYADMPYEQLVKNIKK